VFGRGKYAKFSSMGNGATFCIETLLFAAACYAVGSKEFSVYGDDVIIETELFEAYKALTGFLGFTINEEKSFTSGPFRESCGGDYYDGIDVTPVYIRQLDGRKAVMCHLVNTLASISLPFGRLEAYLLDLVKRLKLPLTPYSEDTQGGINISPSLARPRKILFRKNHIDYCKRYIASYSKRYFVDSRGYYLWFLRRNQQVLFSGPWIAQSYRPSDLPSETSWAAVYDHKYVRKRVCWHMPAEGEPGHLYRWSELLLRG
jgi:hypothetical protein